MRTVLVVDDEPHIRVVLRGYLENGGYRVLEAASGEVALEVLGRDAVDLVLLDVMLPGIDGVEVLRQVRTGSDVAVILVTARAEEVDRLVGLAVGADDYVVKPFSPREVVARVGAVLRRAGARGERGSVIHVDGLRVDEDRREVTVDDEPVELSALEFDLLATLARTPGRVWTRALLMNEVWGTSSMGDDRVVDVHIRSIRARLGDDAAAPRFVATVRGVGYKLVGPRR